MTTPPNVVCVDSQSFRFMVIYLFFPSVLDFPVLVLPFQNVAASQIKKKKKKKKFLLTSPVVRRWQAAACNTVGSAAWHTWHRRDLHSSAWHIKTALPSPSRSALTAPSASWWYKQSAIHILSNTFCMLFASAELTMFWISMNKARHINTMYLSISSNFWSMRGPIWLQAPDEKNCLNLFLWLTEIHLFQNAACVQCY